MLPPRYDILIIEDDPYFYLQFPVGHSGPEPEVAAPGMDSLDPAPSAASAASLCALPGGGGAGCAGGTSGTLSRNASSCSMSVDGSAPLPFPLPPLLGSPPAELGAPGGSRCLSLDSGSEGGGSAASSPVAAARSAAAAAGAQPLLQQPQGGPGGSSSYLSLDRDGRVVRVDSFAKFLAPGLRLGWVTAPPDLLEKLVMAIQAHTVGPCGLSQVRPLRPLCTLCALRPLGLPCCGGNRQQAASSRQRARPAIARGRLG